MKHLKIYIWLMVTVLSVVTIPRVAVAMHPQPKEMVIVEIIKPCKAPKLTLQEMKRLAKHIAKKEIKAVYKSQKEWNALHELWMRESRWDYTAKNPKSSAFGIPQILKMKHDTPMAKQIDLGIKYIKHRYGTPTRALAFHNRNNWY